MPRVRISAQLIEVPPVCACCGCYGDRLIEESATKTRGKRVVHAETKAHAFRVCSVCVGHLEMLTPPGESFSLAMPGAWQSFLARATPEERAVYESRRKPQCQAADVFADFESWEGSIRTFRFDSKDYALRFAQTNRSAGKNVVAEDLVADPSPVRPSAAWGPPPPNPPAPQAPTAQWAAQPLALPAAVPLHAPAQPGPRAYAFETSLGRLVVKLVLGFAVMFVLVVAIAIALRPEAPARSPTVDDQPTAVPAPAATSPAAAPPRERRRHRSRRHEPDPAPSAAKPPEAPAP